MIDGVDASLLALIRTSISADDAGVAFSAPTPEWAAELPGACLNIFLHEVVEERQRRSADYRDIRDERGRVIARQAPARRYKFSYLMSAWDTPATEHALLGRVLQVLAEHDTIPPSLLSDLLPDGAGPVDLAVAEPTPGRIHSHHLWSAFGLPPRSSLDLDAWATFQPAPEYDVAEPAERISLNAGRDVPRPAPGGLGGPPAGRKWAGSQVGEP